MPVLIPFIAYAAGTIAGYSAITVAAITLAASIAVAEYEKIQAQQQARQSYLNSLQDRLIQERSGVATRGYIVGTVRFGGALLYLQPLGSKGEALDEVVAFANNECDIVLYLLGDDVIVPANFPGPKYGNPTYIPASDTFAVTGPTATVTLDGIPRPDGTITVGENVLHGIDALHVTWRQGATTGTGSVTAIAGNVATLGGLPTGSSSVTVSYQVQENSKLFGLFKSGTLTQTTTDWPGYSNPDWDSTHQLLGVCYIRTLMIWDQNVYQDGAPPVTAVLAGRQTDGYPFYDPRDSSNPISCTNPALVAAWWMTLPRFMGGMGIPTDWIDWTTVAAAANICDEMVTVRTLDNTAYEQIKRYSCDTYLDTANSPIDNLNTILSSMAGTRAFTSGKYKIFAGAFVAAAVTLTDDDVVGTKSISVNTANVDDEPYNVATSTISDANQQWQQSNPTAVTNDAYIAEDGYENPLDITLQATTDARRARYLMGIALEESRPAFGLSLSIAGIGETLGLYDTVQLSLSNRPQYAGRTFEIVSYVDNWDGTFDVTLTETKATTYALDPDTYTPTTPVTVPDNSYLWNPPTPTGFEIASITPTTLPDGTAVARVNLVWDPIPPAGNTPGAEFQIRYRITGGDFIDGGSIEGDSTGTTLTINMQDGEQYNFEIRFVNGLGAVSDWADAFTGVNGTPLPTPMGLRLSASSTLFRVPQTGNALPASITLTAIRTGGLSASATWSTSPAVTLGGSGDTRVLTFANDSADAVQITVTVIQATVTYTDTVTIVKVYDGASATIDPTAPPTPTGLTVTAFLSHLLATWDPATFTMGHGYAGTVVYAAQVITGQSVPNFSTAKAVGSSATTAFAFAVDPGTTWAIWIKWQTNDGVLSVTPDGGTNGVQGTATLIGTANLAADLITAAQLADGSVGAAQLVAGAITATKFANGLQPVTVITGALPGTNVGNVIFRTDDGKLYKWNGSTYTAQTAAADIAGQLTDTQIANIAAAKLLGAVTQTQITDGSISTSKLAAFAVTAANIASDTITANQIAAGAIGVSELAAGAVTANAVAANAITAGAISAGAVNAAQIAAGAVTTSKLLVTGQGAALNADPGTVDQTAWTSGPGSLELGIVDATAPNGHVLRAISSSGGYTNFFSTPFPIVTGKTYRVTAMVKNASSGVFYLRLWQTDAAGNELAYNVGVEGVAYSASFTRFSGSATAVAGAVLGQIAIWTNYPSGGGYSDLADIRCEEVIPGELIVDGAITATKLSANSIVVGTAAIEDGAIVNAMIGTAAIETANILAAAVQTLSIAGQAVTVPVSVSLGSPVGVAPDTWTTVCSAVISNSGAPALVLCGGQIDQLGAGVNGMIRLVRDGTVLWTTSSIFLSVGGGHNLLVGQVTTTDNPGSGSHTYQVQMWHTVAATLNCTAAFMASIETKR